MLRRTRNSQGILIGTARTNPGKNISHPSHLADPERTAPLRTVYEALRSIGVDALVSIGGDDTLKTANKFKLFQDTLPADEAADSGRPSAQDDRQRLHGHRFHVRLFHGRRNAGQRDSQPAGRRRGLPRTYFLAETMGRSAGWLAYGAAIAGEASLVISVEDITGKYQDQEDDRSIRRPARRKTRPVMNVDEVVKRIVATMRVREEKEGKEYGVIVMAEGLAELPADELSGRHRARRPRPHRHLAIEPLPACSPS